MIQDIGPLPGEHDESLGLRPPGGRAARRAAAVRIGWRRLPFRPAGRHGRRRPASVRRVGRGRGTARAGRMASALAGQHRTGGTRTKDGRQPGAGRAPQTRLRPGNEPRMTAGTMTRTRCTRSPTNATISPCRLPPRPVPSRPHRHPVRGSRDRPVPGRTSSATGTRACRRPATARTGRGAGTGANPPGAGSRAHRQPPDGQTRSSVCRETIAPAGPTAAAGAAPAAGCSRPGS